MKTFLILFVLLYSFVAMANPSPEEITKAKAAFAAAQIFYNDKDYKSALEKYKEAYTIIKDPTLLFNMAQCYRFLDEYKSSIEAYESFLKERPDNQYRVEIEGWIAEMKPKVKSAPKITPATQPEIVAPATQEDVVIEKPKDTAPKAVLPIVFGVAAAGATTSAVIAGLAAQQLKQDLKICVGDPDPNICTPETKKQRAVRAVISDVSTVAAIGLALAARASYKKSKRERPVVVVSPTQGGAALTLSLPL